MEVGGRGSEVGTGIGSGFRPGFWEFRSSYSCGLREAPDQLPRLAKVRGSDGGDKSNQNCPPPETALRTTRNPTGSPEAYYQCMSDIGRRSALLERSKALRAKATEFTTRLKDQRAKDFMRTAVFNHLDDVDRFFLGDRQSRPSQRMWEEMWLDSAETMLGIAESSFAKFEGQVNSYGGPENVQLIA